MASLSLRKRKKSPKVAQKYIFFMTALSYPTAQTEEFMFQNVAYRPTVFKTRPTTLQLPHSGLHNSTAVFRLLGLYCIAFRANDQELSKFSAFVQPYCAM